ncbi:4877_t:CDS:2, partial [Gigaspora margarita]
MNEFEKFAVNDDSLYKFAAFNNTSYNTIQDDLVFNDTLYNSQTQFGAVSNALYDDNDQNNHENDDVIDYEAANEYDIPELGSCNERSRKPEATKSKDPKKVTTSKCVGCTWQINLSCSEKNNPHKVVYITKLIDEHKNHELNKAHYDFQENLEFTVDMVKDIEFFCNQNEVQSSANSQSSQREVFCNDLHASVILVESYNSKIKRLIFNSNTTLLELAERLSLCILEEDKRTEYALFRASISKAVLVMMANTILPN